MSFSTGFASIVSLFRPNAGPSEQQMAQQAATGGGLDQTRDKVVKDERHKRSLHLTGKAKAKQTMLAEAARATKTKKG